MDGKRRQESGQVSRQIYSKRQVGRQQAEKIGTGIGRDRCGMQTKRVDRLTSKWTERGVWPDSRLSGSQK
jgi:hypothetical protein